MRFNGLALLFLSCAITAPAAAASPHELSTLWEVYKSTYIQGGRVVSLDEGGLTTSEGQGYAMLRAVWSNDRDTFDRVWTWTHENLQVRRDNLFAWKWKDQVLDLHSATDADTDIALALILAGRRFSEPSYTEEARNILASLWNAEVLPIGGRNFIVSGDWSIAEEYPTIHVAYLAPYAYAVFAKEDPGHQWSSLIESSYAVLHWIYFDQNLTLPPETIFIGKKDGQLFVKHPQTGQTSSFGYDAVPIFWRVALDQQWHGRRDSAELRRRMMVFFEKEWAEKGRFLDRYGPDGSPQSNQEGLALYATVHSLALVENKSLAKDIWTRNLNGLQTQALTAPAGITYYLQNWLWFDRAFENRQIRLYDGFFRFWR